MPGIVSYGAYIPPTRLGLSVLAGRPPKEGGPERAVAWNDEDAVTMAVAAGANALRGFDRAGVDALFFASTTYPFREKQGAALIAKALDLRRDARTADVSGSLRAGTDALLAAFDAVAAGSARRALVIASDCRLGAPGSAQEQSFGEGAAAFLVGLREPRMLRQEIEPRLGLRDTLQGRVRGAARRVQIASPQCAQCAKHVHIGVPVRPGFRFLASTKARELIDISVDARYVTKRQPAERAAPQSFRLDDGVPASRRRSVEGFAQGQTLLEPSLQERDRRHVVGAIFPTTIVAESLRDLECLLQQRARVAPLAEAGMVDRHRHRDVGTRRLIVESSHSRQGAIAIGARQTVRGNEPGNGAHGRVRSTQLG
jgi:hypothetical protein